MVDSYTSLGLPEAFRPLVRLYLLRTLVNLSAHRHVMDERRVIDPDMLQDLGIRLPSSVVPYRPDLLVIRLRRKLKELERKPQKPPANAVLTGNLRRLSNTLELTQVEADIVLFLAIVHHVSVLIPISTDDALQSDQG